MWLEHNDLKVLKREDIYELGCNKLHELKLFFLPNYQNPINNDLLFSIWLEFNVITLLQEQELDFDGYLIQELEIRNQIDLSIFLQELKHDEIMIQYGPGNVHIHLQLSKILVCN